MFWWFNPGRRPLRGLALGYFRSPLPGLKLGLDEVSPHHMNSRRRDAGGPRLLIGRFRFHRQREIESGARARLAFGPDFSAVTLDDVLHDGQSEAGAALLAGARFVDAIKTLEDALQSFGGNSRAVVLHAE